MNIGRITFRPLPKGFLLISVLILPCVISAQVDFENVDFRTVPEHALTTESPTKTCDDEHRIPERVFSWADYLVLAALLVVSCGIGMFYGFFDSTQTTSSDFLLGGSSMGTFPMAMSLAASFITAIELLGNPAEMYTYGSQFWMICISFILVVPMTSKLYLPVFMTLRLTSSYEYFSLRFSPAVRTFASGLYILQMIMYTSVAVYAPALALSNVTGMNVYLAVSVVYLVCIFYASQGGMKAVIITDTFQAAVLVGSIILVMYLGERYVGGTAPIWSANYNTERLEIFKMSFNPTVRHSFWSVVIGGTFYWLTMFCSNQASIQKYLSVENISQVRRALWVSCIGLILVYSINFYTGMILVTHYRYCDPSRSCQISAKDEILPYYVMSQMSHLPGIPGLFVAGIFAASLGTVASALNSLAAVTMQDFIEEVCGISIPDNKGAFWAKCISAVYGVLSFLLVFVIARLGSVMQIAISFNGMVGGVTLGLFSLGMFFPSANSKGAFTGAVLAMALIVWMGIGQQISIANETIVEKEKTTGVEECGEINGSRSNFTLAAKASCDDAFFLFRVSFMWYSAIGCLVTVLVGLIVSLLTGPKEYSDVNERLLSPPIKKLLSSLSKNTLGMLNLTAQSKFSHNITQSSGIINISLDTSSERSPVSEKSSRVRLRKTSCPA